MKTISIVNYLLQKLNKNFASYEQSPDSEDIEIILKYWSKKYRPSSESSTSYEKNANWFKILKDKTKKRKFLRFMILVPTQLVSSLILSVGNSNVIYTTRAALDDHPDFQLFAGKSGHIEAVINSLLWNA